MSIFFAVVSMVGSLTLPVTTLAGNPRVFPRDGARPRAIYVVTFSKAAATEASEWTRSLRAQKDAVRSDVFQIAVLEDVPKLFRSFVISSMKRDVPTNLHDHFWVAINAGQTWRECADASNPDEAHVFLLDRNDRIIWRSHGRLSAPKLLELIRLQGGQ